MPIVYDVGIKPWRCTLKTSIPIVLSWLEALESTLVAGCGMLLCGGTLLCFLPSANPILIVSLSTIALVVGIVASALVIGWVRSWQINRFNQKLQTTIKNHKTFQRLFESYIKLTHVKAPLILSPEYIPERYVRKSTITLLEYALSKSIDSYITPAMIDPSQLIDVVIFLQNATTIPDRTGLIKTVNNKIEEIARRYETASADECNLLLKQFASLALDTSSPTADSLLRAVLQQAQQKYNDRMSQLRRKATKERLNTLTATETLDAHTYWKILCDLDFKTPEWRECHKWLIDSLAAGQ